MRTVTAVTASPSASSLDIAKSYFWVAGHGAETLPLSGDTRRPRTHFQDQVIFRQAAACGIDSLCTKIYKLY